MKQRKPFDYYITPAATINEFLTKFSELEPSFDFTTASVLDPSSGGCSQFEMSYPAALKGMGCTNITTVDIRADSRAENKVSYLKWYPECQFDMVITNPPFNLALDYIVTALDDCKDGGFVVMLVRVNYFASVGRRDFWKHHTPLYTIIHAKRPRFDGHSGSCEYCHIVWKKGTTPSFTKLYVV